MNPVVHFEIPTEDRQRVSAFYGEAFGWKTQMLGEEMDNYTLASSCETDETGFPKERGMINGGFYLKKGMPIETPTMIIGVSDVQETMSKITKAGGRVLGEPYEIPGYGILVYFLDSEGNRMGAMQSLTP